MNLEQEIDETPDGVINDIDKLRTVVSNSELAIKLLESKNIYSLTVTVDGQDVAMVRSTIPPPTFKV